MEEIVVKKLNLSNVETWRYNGKVLKCEPDCITIEAYFNRPDTPFHEILLREGDRFVETYFTKRWYNIFLIFDRENKAYKGAYCNVTRPAIVEDGVISYIDLALDLLVYPDGRQLVLDMDEFKALALDPETHRQGLAALNELQELFLKPGVQPRCD